MRISDWSSDVCSYDLKEQYFTSVLERTYEIIRSRQSDLHIRGMAPEEGMRRLVEFTAKIWIEIPEFNRLLASENLHEARHVKQSRKIIAMYNPLLETIDELLKRRKQVGDFRGDRKSTRLNSSH